jgi:uncharacterized membrane protein YbhN (UPF0104 family)
LQQAKNRTIDVIQWESGPPGCFRGCLLFAAFLVYSGALTHDFEAAVRIIGQQLIYAGFWISVVVGASFILAAPIAWWIAPRLRARYSRRRTTANHAPLLGSKGMASAKQERA